MSLLYVTFKGSAFPYSLNKLTLYALLMSLSFLSNGFINIIFALRSYNTSDNSITIISGYDECYGLIDTQSKIYQSITILSGIIYGITEIVSSVCILRSFTKKLMFLSMQFDEINKSIQNCKLSQNAAKR